tara:strand:+ start:367 stop:543 length:177 start_codon:yes stop_codon:yes gene_type:complete
LSYVLKRLAPYILRYIIKKNIEKYKSRMSSNNPFENNTNKKKEKKEQVGEYIDFEEIE